MAVCHVLAALSLVLPAVVTFVLFLLFLLFLLLSWAVVQVDELLPHGESSIPQLSAALVTISRAMDTEMASMPAHEVRGTRATTEKVLAVLDGDGAAAAAAGLPYSGGVWHHGHHSSRVLRETGTGVSYRQAWGPAYGRLPQVKPPPHTLPT